MNAQRLSVWLRSPSRARLRMSSCFRSAALPCGVPSASRNLGGSMTISPTLSVRPLVVARQELIQLAPSCQTLCHWKPERRYARGIGFCRSKSEPGTNSGWGAYLDRPTTRKLGLRDLTGRFGCFHAGLGEHQGGGNDARS